MDDDYDWFRVFRDEATKKEDGELMRALEMSIGGAYSSGAVSQRCVINGVEARCPEIKYQVCPHCVRISKCFPVPYAANRFFVDDHQEYVCGGPMDTLRSNKFCYDATAIECLKTLLARRDGNEYLKSEEYLYKVLFAQDGVLDGVWGDRGKPVYQQVLKELVCFSQIDRQTMLNMLYRYNREKSTSLCKEDARKLIALGLPVEMSDVKPLKEMGSRKEGKKQKKRKKEDVDDEFSLGDSSYDSLD